PERQRPQQGQYQDDQQNCPQHVLVSPWSREQTRPAQFWFKNGCGRLRPDGATARKSAAFWFCVGGATIKEPCPRARPVGWLGPWLRNIKRYWTGFKARTACAGWRHAPDWTSPPTTFSGWRKARR